MALRTVTRLVSVVMVAVLLASCAAMDQVGDTVKDNPKAVLGSLIGGAAGAGIAAAAGGGTGAMLGAGLGGMLIGGFIGNRLDARDKRMASEAAQKAFENNRSGQTSVWNNPDSGHSGTITPTRTTQLANGQYCREYNQTITVGGEQHQAYGTACRQADGTWKIQS